jgi:hypothetical protein
VEECETIVIDGNSEAQELRNGAGSSFDAANQAGASSDAVVDKMRTQIRRPSFCRPSLPYLLSFRLTLLRSHVS